MDKTDLQARIEALTAERAAKAAELEQARADSRQALIEGRPPKPYGHLVEAIDVADAAIDELRHRLVDAHDAESRARRMSAVRSAIGATQDRTVLAERVDAALKELAGAWPEYLSAVTRATGAVANAGGDTTPLRRVISGPSHPSDALQKALVAASGTLEIVRALGVQTRNDRKHGVTPADAERRVALSLEAELLRMQAASTAKPNLARDAAIQLKQVEDELAKDPLSL